MAVYVDEAIWMAGRKWCHLLADDIDELHALPELGLHRTSSRDRRRPLTRTTT